MKPINLHPLLVENLYEEALSLSEEARDVFDESVLLASAGEPGRAARAALRQEALRTTTRMMHAIAWLLNQRAFLAGELTEFQLRQHGTLPTSPPAGDDDDLALLPAAVAEIAERTIAFYRRLERVDPASRSMIRVEPVAFDHLRERLGQAVAR
ncbi:DUF1465 family protein [Aurantiacibacter poecillastricola]|uniref:DUF1465 family protein n=1 Tax=Aurantiacibacter poecillastricola TaxID=3064385 RepID=UPI00273FE50B|nr:DUF1465 family protein [Aurantiacibacter sp. 219JJ12-13]MDP5261210.1 DUF1465 family protein [Aurantiacibacter sp. 219JJ12-13]